MVSIVLPDLIPVDSQPHSKLAMSLPSSRFKVLGLCTCQEPDSDEKQNKTQATNPWVGP